MAEPLEWLRPSSGRVMGWLGLGVAAMVAVAALASGGEARVGVALGAMFLGVLVWAALLRPAIAVSPSTLVMRNMLETVHIPMAAIESLTIRTVLAVRVGEKRYVSPAMGKSRRQTMRRDLRQGKDSLELGPAKHDQPYADFVEERIRRLAEDARARDGIRRGSAEQLALADGVRRLPAWPEIGALAGTGLALVGVLFL